MVTTPSATGTTPTVADSKTEKSRTQLSGDFSTFLLMLTTQLKNQDPGDPMDTNEFTSQLVQFASVEQALSTNEKLDTMIGLQQGSQINNAVNYIGKFVEANGDKGRLMDGVSAFSYYLPSKAETVEISIKDARGGAVFTGSGPAEIGRNDVVWDGTNSFTGRDMPDGTYQIAVIAKDANGNKIEAKPRTVGYVSAATLENGDTKLEIGDIKLGLDDILSVRDPSDFTQ